ncbi:hypothetical protein [Dongia deserti]|uniref:hypothetical protein n=1 Tax=Dongia deserti TaxID=2268030 RepID=UPI0013C3FF50|nr:hypothetical protein [Dongia deserti]
MQTLTALERAALMVPDPITVAHDVNQTMYDALTPKPVDAEKYDLALVPQQDWNATTPDWTEQLTSIFQAVRRKYPVLPPRPSQQDIAATLALPLATTHQLIVGRIFSPSLRHAFKRRVLGSTTKAPARQAS